VYTPFITRNLGPTLAKNCTKRQLPACFTLAFLGGENKLTTMLARLPCTSELYINQSYCNQHPAETIAMALSAVRTSRASEKHVPVCLLSGSLQLTIMDSRAWYYKQELHFIPPSSKHPSSTVTRLFAHNPVLSVGEILKQFKKDYSDRDPEVYVYSWELFVETKDLDVNGLFMSSYAQINQHMPFLCIPEYILNNNCLIICQNQAVQELSTRGRVSSFLATEHSLVDSANRTAVSNVAYHRNDVAESIHSLHFAQNFQEYSAEYRMKVVAMCEGQLANSRRLRDRCTSEALKHEQTQHNVRLVTIAPEHPQHQKPVENAELDEFPDTVF